MIIFKEFAFLFWGAKVFFARLVRGFFLLLLPFEFSNNSLQKRHSPLAQHRRAKVRFRTRLSFLSSSSFCCCCFSLWTSRRNSVVISNSRAHELELHFCVRFEFAARFELESLRELDGDQQRRFWWGSKRGARATSRQKERRRGFLSLRFVFFFLVRSRPRILMYVHFETHESIVQIDFDTERTNSAIV